MQVVGLKYFSQCKHHIASMKTRKKPVQNRYVILWDSGDSVNKILTAYILVNK